MSNDETQIHVDSRSWTGDVSQAADGQSPKSATDSFPFRASPLGAATSPLGSALGLLMAYFLTKKYHPERLPDLYRYEPPPRTEGYKTPAILLFGPLCLLILAVGLGIFIETHFGYFTGDYLLSKADWQEKLPSSFAILAVVCMALLLATKFFTLPNWTNRACAVIGFGLIATSILDYWWVVDAHRHARIVASPEPLLLADGNGCGRKFSLFSRRGPPDPGPCVHGFRAMNSKGESLWLVGNGMATERACVLVQKLADGHGFTWYRRVAYYDLLPEMGRSDFSTETGKRCFDASLMKRFEALF